MWTKTLGEATLWRLRHLVLRAPGLDRPAHGPRAQAPGPGEIRTLGPVHGWQHLQSWSWACVCPSSVPSSFCPTEPMIIPTLKTSIRLVPLAQKGPPASRPRREPQKAQHSCAKWVGAGPVRQARSKLKWKECTARSQIWVRFPTLTPSRHSANMYVLGWPRGPAAHGTHVEPALWQNASWSPPPRPGLPPAPRQKPTSAPPRLPCSKGSVWISVPATIHSTRFLTESTAGREGPAVGLGGAASGTGFLRRPGRPALQRVSECRAWTLCCSGIGH